MSRSIIDIHIVQTVPPSNLNRDDTGSPKTAFYGGVRRARVSSQAWKRATRRAFEDVLDRGELGVRTKQVVEELAARIAARDGSLRDQAESLASQTLKAVGIKLSAPKKDATEESGYLLFFSGRQLDNLAEAAVYAATADGGVAAALTERNVKALADRDHSVDIALFGRMVADIPDINVDAACQVAHAISVHPVEDEYDYYTAVDDRKHAAEETGAGMIGTIEFNSATLYRYATVDADRLRDNLGDITATRRAVEAFVRAFVTSMPTGKQNTFANRTLPDLALVRLRETQPVSFVGAFEEPVRDGISGGRVRGAVERITEYARDVERAYNQSAVASWEVRVGDRTKAAAELGVEVTLEELVSAVGDAVEQRTGQ